MNEKRSSFGHDLLRLALVILLVAFALNEAARLILAVWPVLAVVAGSGILGLIALRVLRSRDHW